MKVVFRTDSSTAIGTGHVMRCLTLAEALRERDAEVTFISRGLPGNIIDTIEMRGYTTYRLPYSEDDRAFESYRNEYDRWLAVDRSTDAVQTKAILEHGSCDWLIVDHYALDEEWEQALRPHAGGILVIDDLANRRHDCDMLLDQNLFSDAGQRYAGLTGEESGMLLGPKYAMLRSEFVRQRRTIRQRDGAVRRLLVFFGGADITNETYKAVRAISLLDWRNVDVDIVVGASNPHRTFLENVTSDMKNVRLHVHVRNMAELMARADLALGASGTTTWERACLGLPSIVTAIAENQEAVGESAASAGIVDYLGISQHVTSESLADRISALLSQPELLREMSRLSMETVDGLGTARVSGALLDGRRAASLEGAPDITIQKAASGDR